MAESLSLTDLPNNLLTEILARLPLRTLFAAKCVSTLFDNLISPNNPDFTELHAAVSSHILVFQFDRSLLNSPSRRLYALDSILDGSNGLPKNFRSTAFHTSRIGNPMYELPDCSGETFTMVNSCNSLLYFVRTDALDMDSLVCNPVTNEYYMIPAADSTRTKTRTVCSWLGFCPATNQYKVLRVCMSEDNVSNDQIPIVKAKVLDVGSNSWRDIVVTPPRLFSRTPWNDPQCFAFLNGVMYWIEGNSSVTMHFFDFQKEKFGSIGLPLFFRNDQIRRRFNPSSMALGVVPGRLILTVYLAKKVFLFFKFSDVWKGIKAIDVPKHCPIGSWFKPVLYLSNVTMLLLSNGGDILSCILKKKIAKFLEFRTNRCPRVVAVAPSFVLLKDILKVEDVIVNSSRRCEVLDNGEIPDLWKALDVGDQIADLLEGITSELVLDSSDIDW